MTEALRWIAGMVLSMAAVAAVQERKRLGIHQRDPIYLPPWQAYASALEHGVDVFWQADRVPHDLLCPAVGRGVWRTS